MASSEVTEANNITGIIIPMLVPAWIPIFDGIQLIVSIIGIIANTATLVTLIVNGGGFSDIIRLLFKVQSVIDCLCCLQATLLFILPPMWKVGNKIIDTFICHTWHGQFMYWVTLCMSVWNLVILALERYLCVCHALKYQLVTLRHFQYIVLSMILSNLLLLSPAVFQIRRVNGQCLSELFWDGEPTLSFFYFYGIFCFFAFYAIPCAFFFILYGQVIINFRQRAKANLGASGSSSVIDMASKQLTKTTIVVTIVFIIAIGFALWYYLLANLGFFLYTLNSPAQKICVLFSVMNSVVNPFIYATFMPVYRQSVKNTFFRSCSKT